MKTAFTLLAVVSCALSTSALADGWKTLAGYNDTVTLNAGETAFIVTVSDNLTVQYTKRNKRPVQFQLGADYRLYGQSVVNRQRIVPTSVRPFPLTGPCTITVKTSGVVSMKVIGDSTAK